MLSDLFPADEPARLAAVRRYDVLDTPPDGTFDRITELATRLFDVPVAIISIVDSDRIWFKSHHGLEVNEVDRDPGLCASAILQDGPWLVSDAAADPRALANPLVAGSFGLRFYAGVPLRTADGYNLGTLCILDQHARELTTDEITTLEDLSAVVMDELELRLSARRAVASEAERRLEAEDVVQTLQEGLLPRSLPHVAGLDVVARYHVANRDQVGGDFYDVIDTPSGCAVVVGDACGKGTRAASLTGIARWALRTLVADTWTPAGALDRLNHVLVHSEEDSERYCTLAIASLDPRPGDGASVRLALGGHPHPLILRTDGSVERVGETATAVGWFQDAAYAEARAELAPGDVLLLFTDGMLEAVAGHGSSDDTALRSLLSPLAGSTAAEVADRFDAAIGDGVLRDDAAFVVVRAT